MLLILKKEKMNREERQQELLNTIHHYCNENPEANIYSIAIQLATKLANEEDRQHVGPALLIALKYIDNE